MLTTAHRAPACSACPRSSQPVNPRSLQDMWKKEADTLEIWMWTVSKVGGLSFSLSLQSTCLQAHMHHAHAPNLLCNITLHLKTVLRSLQKDKDQDLERSPWSRTMHISNEPFCPDGHQCPWTGLRAGREGPPVLRDTVSICPPQSRTNSDVTTPDESLFNVFITLLKMGNGQLPPKWSMPVPLKSFSP